MHTHGWELVTTGGRWHGSDIKKEGKMDATLVEILRRIITKTDEGPRECVGFNADKTADWTGGFWMLLQEAREAVRASDGRTNATSSDQRAGFD